MHILFVDDEPRILQGLRRLLFSRRQQWKASFADSAEAALQILAAEPVDVVVSDVRMPGMSGVELLRVVRQNHPGVARALLSGQVAPDTALEPTEVAHRFLSKPSDPAVLFSMLEQLDRFCADVPLADREIIAGVTSLPCAPERLVGFRRALGGAEPDIGSATAIAQTDVGMTAKLLQLVNSSFLGAAQETADVEVAIRHLGVDVLLTLTESSEVFASNLDVVPGLSISAIGNDARLEAVGSVGATGDRDDAGHLLRDVGRLVLAAYRPERLAANVAEANETGQPLHEVELRNDGVCHCEIGGQLLALWGLPDAVCSAVRHHHFATSTLECV